MKRPSPRLLAGLLVFAQVLALGFFAVSGPLWAGAPGWLGVQTASVGLLLWAAATMGWRHIRISPNLPSQGRLVTTGPYRWIRHPMYTAVLGYTLALVLDCFSAPRLLAWMALVVVLLRKLAFEERVLAERFAEYRAYQKRTWRLLPPLY